MNERERTALAEAIEHCDRHNHEYKYVTPVEKIAEWQNVLGEAVSAAQLDAAVTQGESEQAQRTFTEVDVREAWLAGARNIERDTGASAAEYARRLSALPRGRRTALQADLEAVAARHGLELVKVDGQGVFAHPERDEFMVRLAPTRTHGPAEPAEGETIEVPVTRRARVTLVGRIILGAHTQQARWGRTEPVELRAGDIVAVRSDLGVPFRPGTGVVVPRNDGFVLDLLGVVSPADHDLLYRVEPEVPR